DGFLEEIIVFEPSSCCLQFLHIIIFGPQTQPHTGSWTLLLFLLPPHRKIFYQATTGVFLFGHLHIFLQEHKGMSLRFNKALYEPLSVHISAFGQAAIGQGCFPIPAITSTCVTTGALICSSDVSPAELLINRHGVT
ncbi:Formamidopyrimidine-DNA glycosylase, partial [Dissostichus eleginoides]